MIIKKLATLLSLLILLGVLGCQSAPKDPVFDSIDPDFGLKPFTIPEEWDVVFIGYQFKKFTEEPSEVHFRFGQKSADNTINVEEINKFEKKRSLGTKTVYHISHDLHYAELWISRADPEYIEFTMEQNHKRTNGYIGEYSQIIEVDGRKIYAAGKEGSPPEKYVWTSSDKQYMFFLWFYDTDLDEKELEIANMEKILRQLTEEL